MNRLKKYSKAALEGAWITALDSLRRPSLVLATAALLSTYTAKIWWHTGSLARPGGARTPFLAFLADDLVFWAAVIALAFLAEARFLRKSVRVATAVVTGLLAALSLANVFWLRGTGGQLSLSVIEIGLTRTAEVLPIVQSGLGPMGISLLAGSALLIAGLPVLFRAKWRKDGRPEAPRLATLGFPLLLMALGLAGLVEQRSPTSPGWKLIAANVQVSLVRQFVDRRELAPLPADLPDPSPPPASPRATVDSPNVLVVILEATARRATSLDPHGPTNTPTLVRLAREGFEAESMRAVVPHTSKSLVSIFCGRYPAIQQRIVETADNYPLRCLPAILADNGWSTAFFQSADGRFEQRPRLAARIGFDHFVAWQDIEPATPPLGYLAADDLSLVKPLITWIGEQQRPFFAAVLTSATHHPYELPAWITERTGATARHDAVQRYAALVHGEDVMLAEIVRALDGDERTRDTIVVVFGDHGEAFGEHGGSQHDNIYTEEGLRVPFVIRAPGRVNPGVLREPRSLPDLAPTLLELLDVPYRAERFDGRSLFTPEPPGTRRRFACWYDDTCHGFVEGRHKLAVLPGSRSWVVFDLLDDPRESQPLIDPPEWAEAAADSTRWYHSHRYDHSSLFRKAAALFGGRWICAGKGGACRSFREQP
ncbi:MAG TPA: LTA synthase family protein [Polyangia bacterium]|nr:LTA synthase family protein [Polyangia bacterium]